MGFRKKFGAGDIHWGIGIVGVGVITKRKHGELEKKEQDAILPFRGREAQKPTQEEEMEAWGPYGETGEGGHPRSQGKRNLTSGWDLVSNINAAKCK